MSNYNQDNEYVQQTGYRNSLLKGKNWERVRERKRMKESIKKYKKYKQKDSGIHMHLRKYKKQNKYGHKDMQNLWNTHYCCLASW